MFSFNIFVQLWKLFGSYYLSIIHCKSWPLSGGLMTQKPCKVIRLSLICPCFVHRHNYRGCPWYALTLYIALITEDTSPWLQRLQHREHRGYITVITESVIDMPMYCTSPWLQSLSLICPCSVHRRDYRYCPWYALVLYIAVITKGTSPCLQRYITVITEVVPDMPLLCTSPRLQRVHYRDYRWYITVITEGLSPWL